MRVLISDRAFVLASSLWFSATSVVQACLAHACQDGQMFLRSEMPAGTVLTYDLSASTGPKTDISGMS